MAQRSDTILAGFGLVFPHPPTERVGHGYNLQIQGKFSAWKNGKAVVPQIDGEILPISCI
jgi:hypothetical protein